MANSRKKNAIYIDTIGTITVDAITPVIAAIMITPNAVNSRVKIKESVSGTIVIDVAIESTETRYIDFMDFYGLVVTQNFEVVELTNVDTVVLYGHWLAPTGSTR